MPAHVGVQRVGEEAADGLQAAAELIAALAVGDGAHEQADEPGQAAAGSEGKGGKAEKP